MKKIIAVFLFFFTLFLTFTVNCFAVSEEIEEVIDPLDTEEIVGSIDGSGVVYDYVPDPLKNYPDPVEFETMVDALPDSYAGTDCTYFFNDYIVFFAKSGAYDDGSLHINVAVWDSSKYDIYIEGKNDTSKYFNVRVSRLDDSYAVNGFRQYYWDYDTESWIWYDNNYHFTIYYSKQIYSTVELSYSDTVYLNEGPSTYYQEYLDDLTFKYPFADGLKAVWITFGDIINALPSDIYRVAFWILAAVIIVGVLKAF